MWVEMPLPFSNAEFGPGGSVGINAPPSIRINGTLLPAALALASGSNVKIDSKTADFLIKLYI
jgi:hypothetical protein